MSQELAIEPIPINVPFSVFISGEGEKPNDDRPYIATQAGINHWRLVDNVHQWLVDHGVDYCVGGYRKSDPEDLWEYQWQVGLYDPKMATLFKLMFA